MQNLCTLNNVCSIYLKISTMTRKDFKLILIYLLFSLIFNILGVLLIFKDDFDFFAAILLFEWKFLLFDMIVLFIVALISLLIIKQIKGNSYLIIGVNIMVFILVHSIFYYTYLHYFYKLSFENILNSTSDGVHRGILFQLLYLVSKNKQQL